MKLSAKRLRSKKGFTLVEVLIVLVILGVMAGLAIPAYMTSVEKSLKAEALQMLAATRDAETRYYIQSQTFGTMAQIDFDPSSVAGDPPGTVRHFTYAFSVAPTSVAYTVQATRNGVGGNGNAANTVTLTQAGVVGGTM